MQASLHDITGLLARTDLFESFQQLTLSHLAATARLRQLSAGEVLFLAGDEGSSLFVVMAGQLEVYRSDRCIALINPAEYIGELALFDPGPRSASVRAVPTTLLVELSHQVYENYLSSEPLALAAMIRTITRRLRGVLDETQAAYEDVNLQVHDMLNLVNVLASASLIEDALPADDYNQRFVRMIVSVQERLALMMRSALRRARGTAGVYPKEPTDLEALVRQCVECDLALHPDLRQVRVSVQVAPSLPPCSCNPSDLRRVVENLVINAAQAAPTGELRVRLWHDDGNLRLAIADNGGGIPPDVLPRIFEPHFTTKPYGNGLGLASCRHVIEDLHGGRLLFDSVAGQGTTFTCELPA